VDEELQKEFEEIAEGIGCELLECEFKGGVLRLTIDHKDGVNHELCQTISRQASAILDVSDFGSGRYVLEVTSPGLDRKFYSDNDYEKYLGRLTKVTWKSSGMDHKMTVVGRLQAFSDGQRKIELNDEHSDKAYSVSLDDIQIARLEPEI
jgi:ribosome maturation factor RimP